MSPYVDYQLYSSTKAAQRIITCPIEEKKLSITDRIKNHNPQRELTLKPHDGSVSGAK